MEFENDVIKPHRAAGTKWISHKLLALENMTHFENTISDTSKKTDKATLEGKRQQMEEADTVLMGALYDLLQPVKELLFSQREDISFHKVSDVMNVMRNRYIRLLRKFEKHPNTLYKLSKIKDILSKIEDGKYQGIQLKHFERSKNSLTAKAPGIVENIIKTLDKYFERFNNNNGILEDDGNDDKVLFHVANVINMSSWATQQSPYDNLVNSFNLIFKNDHPVINNLDSSVEDEFIELLTYAQRYHYVNEISSLDLWQVLHSSTKLGGRFGKVFIIIELCLCAPYANAIVERFLNYMKLVKTDWRSKLNAANLESLLRIRVEGPELSVFASEYCSTAVDLWWSEKQRRLNQGKRTYSERKGKAKKVMFSNEFAKEFLASSSDDE